jgi:hypothetical protein
MTQLRSILLIGCGNMGGAMLTGWLAAGMDPAQLSIRFWLKRQAGLRCFAPCQRVSLMQSCWA